ncbi:hypothetical protein KR100_04375 [Synechococcus sp. KORDI-100]|nr:hypothetical protein KR100_04375 [Synechococcus sp. KORDI-100]
MLERELIKSPEMVELHLRPAKGHAATHALRWMQSV